VLSDTPMKERKNRTAGGVKIAGKSIRSFFMISGGIPFDVPTIEFRSRTAPSCSRMPVNQN